MTPSTPSSNDERTRRYLELLGQHERRLRGFILALVPHWADAEDIAQEVRIRLWEQFDNYDPAKNSAFGPAPSHTTAFSPTARTQSRHGMVINSELMDRIAKQVTGMSQNWRRTEGVGRLLREAAGGEAGVADAVLLGQVHDA